MPDALFPTVGGAIVTVGAGVVVRVVFDAVGVGASTVVVVPTTEHGDEQFDGKRIVNDAPFETWRGRMLPR